MTPDTNRLLTQVGPGTPMGHLLRRYWHPVAGASELQAPSMKPVRLFGEDLLLVRTASGSFGLLPRRCRHRGADLSFGIVEEDGVRCHYHGWRYDLQGHCVERPFDAVVQPQLSPRLPQGPGYLVREKAGMLWVYMGPSPAPELPDWETFSWPHTFRQVVIAEVPCNWLQCQENTVDPVHFEWLHNNVQQRASGDQGAYSPRTLRMAVEDRPWGLLSRRYREGSDESAPLWSVGRAILWPNGWYFGHHFEWKVPVDDTHTLFVTWAALRVPRECEPFEQETVPAWRAPVRDEHGEWIASHVGNQDVIAWVSQGEIADRSSETLSASDVGVVALRRRLMEDLKAVEEGRDPRAVLRDPLANRRIELPCVSREDMMNGLPLAQMQEHPLMGPFLRDFYLMAGQPQQVREAFEAAMKVKSSRVDIAKFVPA
jgi:5,5'-dehydrodivanillate O-demethylase